MKKEETNIAGAGQGTPNMPAGTETETPLKGRAAFLNRYKTMNPYTENEPDDETLFDFADRGYADKEDLQGKYDELNGSNEKLASIISEDPRFAQFIAMIASGEDMMYSLGKVFGNLIDELDDKGLEQLREGQKEYKQRYKQIRDNFNNFESNLKSYGEKNNLTPDQLVEIRNAVFDLATAFNEGNIGEDIIDVIYKGLDYDNEHSSELEAAQLAGRNAAIEDIKSKKTPEKTLPDLGGQKVNPTKPNNPQVQQNESYKDYFDQLQRIK